MSLPGRDAAPHFRTRGGAKAQNLPPSLQGADMIATGSTARLIGAEILLLSPNES
jgi:hypothetical protein